MIRGLLTLRKVWNPLNSQRKRREEKHAYPTADIYLYLLLRRLGDAIRRINNVNNVVKTEAVAGGPFGSTTAGKLNFFVFLLYLLLVLALLLVVALPGDLFVRGMVYNKSYLTIGPTANCTAVNCIVPGNTTPCVIMYVYMAGPRLIDLSLFRISPGQYELNSKTDVQAPFHEAFKVWCGKSSHLEIFTMAYKTTPKVSIYRDHPDVLDNFDPRFITSLNYERTEYTHGDIAVSMIFESKSVTEVKFDQLLAYIALSFISAGFLSMLFTPTSVRLSSWPGTASNHVHDEATNGSGSSSPTDSGSSSPTPLLGQK